MCASFLPHKVGHAFGDNIMVPIRPLQRGLIRRALRRPQNSKWRLGYDLTLSVHPSQRIAVIGGSDINQSAFGRGGLYRLCRKNNIGQIFDGFFELRIALRRIFPDLIGQGRQIHFPLVVTVKDSGFFAVQILNRVFVVIIFKERLVGADHLSVFG